jgi:hypothetical protein
MYYDNFLSFLLFPNLFTSEVFSFILPLMSLFYHLHAPFCLFGIDSFQQVNDLFVQINCLILLLSPYVYHLYFFYSGVLFLSSSS